MEGTVEAMGIRRVDNSCLVLSVRIDRGPAAPYPRRIRAWNDVVCGALKGVAPLPRGASATALMEWTPDGWVVWEMTGGGRRLVAYEGMRTRREHQQRVAGWGRTAVYVLCIPFVVIVAVYLCMEALHRLLWLFSLVDRG